MEKSGIGLQPAEGLCCQKERAIGQKGAAYERGSEEGNNQLCHDDLEFG